MNILARKTQPCNRQKQQIGGIFGALAQVLLLLLWLKTPNLMADVVGTNEVPAQIYEILCRAGQLPVGHVEREAYLKKEFATMGSEGIDFLIRELKKPATETGPHGGEMRVATFASTAARIYAGLDSAAHVRLIEELQKDSSKEFWRNACFVYASSDHVTSLDVLAAWVTDNGADVEYKSQISARAFELLRVKLVRNHLPVPVFTKEDDDFPLKFQNWWQANRQAVLQLYLKARESVAVRSGSSMRAIPKKETYKVGEPVVLQVEVQNTGNRPVSVNRNHPLLDYDIVVLGPDGKNIPLSAAAEGVKKKQQLVSRRIKRSLAPAQRTHEDVEISRYFEMQLPGVYKICISRHLLPVEQATSSLPSATITVIIEER